MYIQFDFFSGHNNWEKEKYLNESNIIKKDQKWLTQLLNPGFYPSSTILKN